MADDELEEMIGRYVRGEATDEDVAELSRLLEAKPTLIQDFVAAADTETNLHDTFKGAPALLEKRAKRTSASRLAARPARAAAPQSRSAPRNTFKWAALGASVAAMAALVVYLNMPQPKPPAVVVVPQPERPAIARIMESVQNAVIVRAGVELPVRGETALYASDRVRVAPGTMVGIVYADNTSVAIGSQVELTLAILGEISTQPTFAESSAGKKIHLESGELTADVAKQPAGKPMIITTPRASAEVLGTQLKLRAKEEQTRLDVLEGKVRLQRLADSAIAVVSDGEFAVAGRDTAAEFSPRAISPKARIAVTCDDGYEIYLNGVLLGRQDFAKGTHYFQAQAFQVSLVRGENVIAVKGTNIDNIAGLLVEMQVDLHRLVTGKHWKISHFAKENWTSVDFDDSSWGSAFEFGMAIEESQKHARATMFPSDSKAQWIWSQHNRFSSKPGENTVYFRYKFDLTQILK